MKFKLRGNQDLILDDSAYWTQGTQRAMAGLLAKPVNGVLDWPVEDLKELAQYAEIKADLLSGPGVDSDPSTRSEVRTLRSLAKRIDKAIAEGK